MSLGWIITISIIGSLFILDIASKIIINHTNWLCRVFEKDLPKKIHYFCSIIIILYILCSIHVCLLLLQDGYWILYNRNYRVAVDNRFNI